jgi:hypothetical protein
LELGEFPETAEEMIALAQKLTVRTREGKNKALDANAVQRQFERLRGRENVVLKARQMGMTTWIAARFFLRTIAMPGTLTLHVAHTQEAAESMFRTVRRMWQNLPEDLREGKLRLARSNVRQMVFRELDSEIRVASAADMNAGRGLSVQNLHCSEVSRWPGDAVETLAGLRATLAPNGECVMESTPNGAHGAFYEAWCRAVDPVEDGSGVRDVGAVRHFFPWWMESNYLGPRVERAEMSPEECALVDAHELMPEQIGFRRHLERTYGPLRSQEFAEDAETCFRATGACCFELEAVEKLLRDVPEPISRRRNGALWVWLSPRPGRTYMVAVDTAGGGADGDFAAVQVVDVMTGMQCAELQQRLRPAELARVVAELAREYGGATVVVERNNHGAAVLAHLETGERYEQVWRDRAGEAGWLTTAPSKAAMIARLGSAIMNAPLQFKSRRLLAECRTFVSGAGGRMGASGGSHDDLVMAIAMAECARAELLLRRFA